MLCHSTVGKELIRGWVKSYVGCSCEAFLEKKELKEKIQKIIFGVKKSEEVNAMCHALVDCINHGYRCGKEVSIEIINPLDYDFGEPPSEFV